MAISSLDIVSVTFGVMTTVGRGAMVVGRGDSVDRGAAYMLVVSVETTTKNNDVIMYLNFMY